jgi:hypothetical protein
MALISQIFLHSRNKQQHEANQTIYIKETIRLHLKKKNPTKRKTQSEEIKIPNQLKEEQKIDTLFV